MITIPDEWYVGVNPENEYVNITENGNDANAIKRKLNVDKNSKTQSIMKNELLSGYKISQEVYRDWYYDHDIVWSIQSPLGFKFDISVNNLSKIMQCTTITNGVIEGNCILGKIKNKIVLLPENSSIYKEAVTNTNLKKKDKIDISTCKEGDILLLDDKKEIIYLGRHKTICCNYNWQSYTVKIKPYSHCYIENDKTYFYICTTQKINNVIDKVGNSNNYQTTDNYSTVIDDRVTKIKLEFIEDENGSFYKIYDDNYYSTELRTTFKINNDNLSLGIVIRHMYNNLPNLTKLKGRYKLVCSTNIAGLYYDCNMKYI